MRIEKRGKIIIITVFVAVILVGVFSALFFLPDVKWYVPRNKIAIIEVEGEITECYEGGANPETIRELLIRAEEEVEKKAVVLRINSGGGTAGASWDMYRAVKRVEKPVVASIGDKGASGAFLVAVAADEIVATPMSVVGSIGASLEFPFDIPANASEEAEEISSLPSGEFKDVRNISDENITRIAKGGWFTGEEGLRMGLVDKIGNMDDAIEDAAKLANISLEDAKIVTLRIEDSKVIEGGYV